MRNLWICWVWMALLIYPQWFKVNFEASPENYSIAVTIESDTNSKIYFERDEILVASAGQSSMQIPRHALPHGGYHVVAELIRWANGEPYVVDHTDTLILVN